MNTSEKQTVVSPLLPEKERVAALSGCYVYGVASGNTYGKLGAIGLENENVFTVPYRDIVAIVHQCSNKPYESDSDVTVHGWVRNHQKVLDAARERFGTIIPMKFDTILGSPKNLTVPEQIVKDWLKDEYGRLCTLIKKFRGKDEYVVQIWYEPGVVIKRISEESNEVKRIKDEMSTKTPGTAYLYQQKLGVALRTEIDRLADRWFKDIFERVTRHIDDVLVDQIKKQTGNKAMLLNLSCLVAKDRVAALGEELQQINNEEGFSVHFSGPWPPYSFVIRVMPLSRGAKDAT